LNLTYHSISQIYNNALESNDIGLQILETSFYNNIFQNEFRWNSEIGIKIESDNNFIFHNNIISNLVQADEDGSNIWNNSVHEGNYWSDYQGLDNGANGRIAGDGIGDTLIPHHGMDNYPFMKPSAWRILRPPVLLDPGEIELNETFMIYWSDVNVDLLYILQLDENPSFSSPIEIYNGSAKEFEVTINTEGTYYFRIKSYNSQIETKWSNVVDIIVDLTPEPPKGLKISVWPEGNTLNLSWKATDSSIVEYEIFVRTLGDFDFLTRIQHPNNYFDDTDRKDGIRYYYKLRALDKYGRWSENCTEQSGIPADIRAPSTPKGLTVLSYTYYSATLTWNKNPEDDVVGYNVYRSRDPAPGDWSMPVNGDIPVNITSYTDRTLDENTDYYFVISAVDEVPNESPKSTLVHVKTYLYRAYPQPPKIVQRPTNFSIPEDTVDDSTLNLLTWFNDANNDILHFSCSGQSQIEVAIIQNNGTVILTPAKNWNGKETITFFAFDGKFNTSDNITITITGVNDPPGPVNILKPEDGQQIETGTLLDFEGTCEDPDVVYGDVLSFSWTSSISGNLGKTEILTGYELTVGEHVITLTVTDSENEKINTTITIIVKDKTSREDSKSEGVDFEMFLLGLVIVLIVVIIIIFVLLKRRQIHRADEPQRKGDEVGRRYDRDYGYRTAAKSGTLFRKKPPKDDLDIEELDELEETLEE
jgi:fibronectin type 3 domain-containing protein